MEKILFVLLCVDTVLLATLIVLMIVKLRLKSKEIRTEIATTEDVKVVNETASTQKIKEVLDVQETQEELKIGDIEQKSSAKRIPFAVKLLALDKNVQGYYDAINNAFYTYRKINIRLSLKGVSYRFGKELVAKLAIRGKTMKLYLALDLDKFNEKVYFQKDSGDVKTYAEVPFTVKVKSDRGLSNALKLITALCEEKSIEKKSRVLAPLNSIQILRDSLAK